MVIICLLLLVVFLPWQYWWQRWCQPTTKALTQRWKSRSRRCCIRTLRWRSRGEVLPFTQSPGPPTAVPAPSSTQVSCSRLQWETLLLTMQKCIISRLLSERSLSPLTEALSECQHPSITHLNWTFTTKRLDTLLCYETISRLTLHNNRFC